MGAAASLKANDSSSPLWETIDPSELNSVLRMQCLPKKAAGQRLSAENTGCWCRAWTQLFQRCFCVVTPSVLMTQLRHHHFLQAPPSELTSTLCFYLLKYYLQFRRKSSEILNYYRQLFYMTHKWNRFRYLITEIKMRPREKHKSLWGSRENWNWLVCIVLYHHF